MMSKADEVLDAPSLLPVVIRVKSLLPQWRCCVEGGGEGMFTEFSSRVLVGEVRMKDGRRD